MNLSFFAANGAFSQRSLSIFGNPSGADSDNTGTARMSEEHLLEQMRRVPQAPKMRKNSGGPKGKSDLSEKNDRFIKVDELK